MGKWVTMKNVFCPHIIHPKQHADGGCWFPLAKREEEQLIDSLTLCCGLYPLQVYLALIKKKDQFNSSLLTTLNPKPYYFTYYYTF
jgi:hypothetical protein